jgi:hypothetical protein
VVKELPALQPQRNGAEEEEALELQVLVDKVVMGFHL